MRRGCVWRAWFLPPARYKTPTDCTRPALRPRRTFFHKTGDISKPTKRSSTRRACWAFTKFMSMVRGASMALRMAFLVISWNTMRLVVAGFKPNTSAKCHEMASPSRSSSDANQTVSAAAASFFNLDTTSFFSALTVYWGKKPFSTSTPRVRSGKSRMWPKLETTRSSEPKYCSMVLALAGDSTITRLRGMVEV